jgi:hypothetical protein
VQQGNEANRNRNNTDSGHAKFNRDKSHRDSVSSDEEYEVSRRTSNRDSVSSDEEYEVSRRTLDAIGSSSDDESHFPGESISTRRWGSHSESRGSTTHDHIDDSSDGGFPLTHRDNNDLNQKRQLTYADCGYGSCEGSTKKFGRKKGRIVDHSSAENSGVVDECYEKIHGSSAGDPHSNGLVYSVDDSVHSDHSTGKDKLSCWWRAKNKLSIDGFSAISLDKIGRKSWLFRGLLVFVVVVSGIGLFSWISAGGVDRKRWGSYSSGSVGSNDGLVGSNDVGNNIDHSAKTQSLSSTFAAASSRWESVDLSWQATIATKLGEQISHFLAPGVKEIGRILSGGWVKVGEGWDRAGKLN